ncbi:T9SS type A sorting domain-containing protein [Cecembia rubra]
MSGEFEDGTYDVSHLKPGLYIIEIQTDLQVVRKRVIIR